MLVSSHDSMIMQCGKLPCNEVRFGTEWILCGGLIMGLWFEVGYNPIPNDPWVGPEITGPELAGLSITTSWPPWPTEAEG